MIQTTSATRRVRHAVHRATPLSHGVPPLRIAGVIAVAAALFVGGCRKPAPPDTATKTEAERGPYSLRVEASPGEAWVGDPIRVQVTMNTPEDSIAILPDADAFAPPEPDSATPTAMPGVSGPAPSIEPEPTLDVLRVEDDPPRPAETGTAWRRTFIVAAPISGDVAIPALTAFYGPKPADYDPNHPPTLEQQLTSKPLTIKIKSALTSQDTVADPRKITGVELPPRPPWPLWVWLAIGGGVIVLAGLIWWALRAAREAASRPAPPVPADMWALDELRRLERVDWFAERREREFYYRLTEIVRAYIERQFGLNAPDMTTEEFLRATERDRRLPRDAVALRVFLEACDLVKYAALEPQPADAQRALETARDFVQSTAAAVRRAATIESPQAAPPAETSLSETA